MAGLLRAIIVTCLCYFALERIWFSDKNPLAKEKKKEYEKKFIFAQQFSLLKCYSNLNNTPVL